MVSGSRSGFDTWVGIGFRGRGKVLGFVRFWDRVKVRFRDGVAVGFQDWDQGWVLGWESWLSFEVGGRVEFHDGVGSDFRSGVRGRVS